MAFACLNYASGHNTHPIAASNGFNQSPGPPLLGNAWVIITAHHHGHKNGLQKWYSIFNEIAHSDTWVTRQRGWPRQQEERNIVVSLSLKTK